MSQRAQGRMYYYSCALSGKMYHLRYMCCKGIILYINSLREFLELSQARQLQEASIALRGGEQSVFLASNPTGKNQCLLTLRLCGSTLSTKKCSYMHIYHSDLTSKSRLGADRRISLGSDLGAPGGPPMAPRWPPDELQVAACDPQITPR